MSAIYRRRAGELVDSPAADFAEALAREAPISARNAVDFDLAATTAVQLVPHKLKQAYRGAAVVMQSGNATVAVRFPSASPDARRFVAVRQSSAVAQKIKLLVW